MTNKLLILSALALFAGCDYVEQAKYDKERADRDYRTAMADYQAGRLSQAVKGLTKVCAADPTNSSARFQLACLLQDAEKDYAGAYCSYHEYLQLVPGSEKAKLASDRLLASEAGLAKELAKKYGLDKADQAEETIKVLRVQLSELNTTLEATRKELNERTKRVAFLEEEAVRLKAAFREDPDADDTPTFSSKDVRDEGMAILNEHRDDAQPTNLGIDEAKRLLAEDDTDDSPVSLDEAKELLDEIVEEPPMIVQAPDAKEKRDAAQKAADEAKAEREKLIAASQPKLEPIPEGGIYIVKEGDTLYKIANRFYGKTAAWRTIREVNKASVSTDGRVKIGQKLLLPPRK